MTARGGSPLARAVRTNSRGSTSSISARLIRMIEARAGNESAIAGRTMCWRALANVAHCPASRLSARYRRGAGGGGGPPAAELAPGRGGGGGGGGASRRERGRHDHS